METTQPLARARHLAALLEDFHRFSFLLTEAGVYASPEGHLGACQLLGDIRAALGPGPQAEDKEVA